LEALERVLPISAASGRCLLDWLFESTVDAPFPAAWELWQSEPEMRRRIELDAVSHRQVSALNAEWDLTPVWEKLGQRLDWENIDVVFQVQGPLLVMPLAWLNFGGAPLFRRVASTSTAVSLALRYASDVRAGRISKVAHRALSVHWIGSGRERYHGLPLLHSAVRCRAGSAAWELRTLGDEPLASAANLAAALSQPYGLAVIGAHGNPSEAGVQLADNETWCGECTDLKDVETLLLCSCAVGRLTQNGQRDVEGLYARLATRGARCVVAARWEIADFEAAVFLGEFVNRYIDLEQRQGWLRQFDRARVFNAARQSVLNAGDRIMSVTNHVASAFDVYGLG